MRVRLVGSLIAALLILPLACNRGAHADEAATTPCSDVVPGCRAERLPNVILTGGESDGAMGDVDDADLSGIISFDEALRLGASEDYGGGDAETVRVVLGTADPSTTHWGSSSGIYYAVEWDGVCMPAVGGFVIGPSPTGSSPPKPSGTTSCEPRRWATVIDARTGRFIVGGT